MIMEEKRYAIALTCLTGFSPAIAVQLYRELDSAKAVFDNRKDLARLIPDSSPRLAKILSNWDEALQRADTELLFTERYGIEVLTFGDEHYPSRLRECTDAPLVLYYKGQADLNQSYIINIVGTRHCTTYGQDLVRRLLTDLKTMCPQVLVVSGLAYGIDVCAHTQALSNGFETVGVLAHGLEKIYPTQHRDIAKHMVTQGGLLTEYMSNSHMDKANFVRRNRIVAGMCDATILVESAAKGGGLITCGIAQDYNRSVFAFPGAVGARYSEGCNNLIRDNGAQLINGADDLVNAMGWQSATQLQKIKNKGIERDLFPDLSNDERLVVQALDATGDLQLNILSIKTNIPIGNLTALLFQLEMKGIVRPLAGGCYHLLK